MPSEQRRFELREGLIESIGEDRAETLMESLPPVSWDELVTKEWAQAQFTALRGEFNEQIGGLHKEIGGLHKEIGGLSKEIGGLSKEIGGLSKEIGALHVANAENSQKVSDKLDSMRRWVVGSVVAVVGAVVGSGVWFG